MKKILLMVAAVVLVTPFFVSSQMVPAATLTDQFTGDQTTCVDLKYNMAYRSRDAKTNGEVSDLQEFLVSQRYLSGEPTGYFGAVTLAAVKKFQSVVGIGSVGTPGYGGVGPKSRAKIKTMTCGDTVTTSVVPPRSDPYNTLYVCNGVVSHDPSCPTTPQATPSISLNSPISNATFKVGDTIPIQWGFSNAPKNSQAVIDMQLISSTSGISGVSGGTWQSKEYPTQIKKTDSYYKTTGVGQLEVPGYYQISAQLVSCDPRGCSYSNLPNSGNTVWAKSGFVYINVIGTTPEVSTSATPTVEFLGAPVLSLSYSAGKEVELVATAKVKITAGAKPLSFNAPNGGPGQLLKIVDSNGNNPQVRYEVGSVVGGLSETAVLLAGVSVTYDIKYSVSPNQLFAGVYKVSTADFYDANGVLAVPSAFYRYSGSSSSNLVTIVGERAPYITGVNLATSGNDYAISGSRFDPTSNSVTINGVTRIIASSNSTIIFNPANFGITTPGAYPVQVSTTEGASNIMYTTYLTPTTTTTSAPTITFSASPMTVVQGGSTTLTWSSTNATSCSSNWGTTVGTSGVEVRNLPYMEANFMLTCTGAGGSVSKTVSILMTATTTVAPVQTPPTTGASPVAVTITPAKTTALIGETVGVSWTVAQPQGWFDCYFYDVSAFSGSMLLGRANSEGAQLSKSGVFTVTSATAKLVQIRSACNVYAYNRADNPYTEVLTNVNFVTKIVSAPSSNQFASVIGAFSGAPTPSVTTSKWVYSWSRNLEIGSLYAEDVSALQTALTKEGVYGGEATGGFYSQTYLAVKALQSKYGIDPTGFVGPTTRMKLNELYK